MGVEPVALAAMCEAAAGLGPKVMSALSGFISSQAVAPMAH